MYGDDYEYAESRLSGTIVREAATNEPLFVQGISPEGVTSVKFLSGGRATLRLDELNLEPVPLGYSNNPDGQPSYLCRVPMRHDWRQGLRPNTTHATVGRVGVGDKSLRKTIMGKYPTIEKAITVAYAGGSTAFSRNWAILGDKTLNFRGKVVGELREGGCCTYMRNFPSFKRY